MIHIVSVVSSQDILILHEKCQSAFTFSMLTIGTLEQGVKYIQS